MAKIARACDAEECDRPVLARGVCKTHYARAVKDGSIDTLGRVRALSAAVCLVDGCEKRPRAHGLCSAHYTRQRRHGDPVGSAPRVPAAMCAACGQPRTFSEATGRWRCQGCVTTATRRWRERNPDGAKAMARRRYANNKDVWRLYAEQNRARISAETRRRRMADLEGVRAKERAAWAALTPDERQRRAPARRAGVARYRARKYGAVCEHGQRCVTPTYLAAIRSLTCQYCGDAAEHADHYVPLAKGGLHCIQNIVPACGRCNRSKGARMPHEWTRVPP